MRYRAVGQGQVAVDRNELKTLRRKAENHDAFVETMREMGRRQVGHIEAVRRNPENEYARGWLRCLREVADMVANRH